mgnify:CR=1 FL=1
MGEYGIGRLTGKQLRPEDYQVGPFRLDKLGEVSWTSMEDFWSTGCRLECKVDVMIKKEVKDRRE